MRNILKIIYHIIITKNTLEYTQLNHILKKFLGRAYIYPITS